MTACEEDHSEKPMTAYEEIQTERARQDAQWGGPEHDDKHSPAEWVGFIRHRARSDGSLIEYRKEYRKRLVQIAALAVAAIESYDRKQRVG